MFLDSVTVNMPTYGMKCDSYPHQSRIGWVLITGKEGARAGGEFVFIAATEVGNPPNTAKMTAHSFPRCRSCRRMSQYGTTATAEAK